MNEPEYEELTNLLERLPKSPVPERVEKNILKEFRKEESVATRLSGLLPGYTAIFAGILAGLILGYLINPYIKTITGTNQRLLTNQAAEFEIDNEAYYLQQLVADNGGDLW